MSKRRITRFRPGIERLEAKLPLSSPGSTLLAHGAISPDAVKPLHGYLVYRITNPNRYNNHVNPPFGQVLVQAAQPVPGQQYNVMWMIMRNGTTKTFTPSDNLTVRLSSQRTTVPILTGNEVWKPGQWFVFYVLTKKYYPFNNQIAGGFVFDLGGAKSVAVPGPSGIFLRVKYNPVTFPNTLNWIVTHGPGVEGGAGIKYGLPVTSIYEFLPSLTARHDFGGYF